MKKFIKNLLLALLIISSIGGQPVLAADYDLKTYVYEHLENWDTEFKIDYYNKDVIDVILDIAKKDDYLSISLNKLVYERKGNEATVKVTYKTTKEQEEYVNNELANIIKFIISDKMSDFDKVKVINNYLIDRYRYDDSLISNNAYSALITGKTTCQGYALTAYKMLKLSGIENRIVTGELEGVPHGWNLVKLNNKWYHLDITNNDALSSDKYFLKSDKALKRDGFTWKYNDYPACDEDYNELSNNNSNLNVNLSVTNNVTKGLSGSIQQSTTGYKAKFDGNWISKNNLWFFIKNNGINAIGWNMIDSNWYYLGDDGVMKTGWIYSSGKWYYCYPDSGAMAVNTVINGYKVDSDGTWIG